MTKVSGTTPLAKEFADGGWHGFPKNTDRQASFPERPMTGTVAPEQWRRNQGRRVPMLPNLRGASSSPEIKPGTREAPAEEEARMSGPAETHRTLCPNVRG